MAEWLIKQPLWIISFCVSGVGAFLLFSVWGVVQWVRYRVIRRRLMAIVSEVEKVDCG